MVPSDTWTVIKDKNDIAVYLKTGKHEIYKTKEAIVIEKDNKFFSLRNENWDEFINDDHLFQKVQKITFTQSPDENKPINDVQAPIGS